MFQNSSQLDAAMKEILNIFRQGDDTSALERKYDGSERDLAKAIDACLSKGYLTGVSYSLGAHDDLTLNVSAPHVTASGMDFISES